MIDVCEDLYACNVCEQTVLLGGVDSNLFLNFVIIVLGYIYQTINNYGTTAVCMVFHLCVAKAKMLRSNLTFHETKSAVCGLGVGMQQ